MTEQKESQDYGNTGFIVSWTILIMFGLIFEFFGRLVGYANNPLSFFHPGISAFSGIVAAIIILAGYLTLTSARAKQRTMTRRKGVLLIALGAFMLVGFFIFKQVIPLVFG
ncbi:MAG: hypothetical protein LBL27_00345 [Coriobacteriales bacterium]|jgi:hypothetical protein|nr:hypothetical protein [Coriobacteriales bacterium]